MKKYFYDVDKNKVVVSESDAYNVEMGTVMWVDIVLGQGGKYINLSNFFQDIYNIKDKELKILHLLHQEIDVEVMLKSLKEVL